MLQSLFRRFERKQPGSTRTFGMLRVWRMSGEQLASLALDDMTDVKDLKQALRREFDCPACLQQLLHDGSSLDDAARQALGTFFVFPCRV